MKLILHIGMGKTGSSSIQRALSESAEMLRAQKVEYLGMWFDMIDPAFRGVSNQDKFYSQPPEVLRQQAQVFLGALRRRAEEAGTETFILSNEAFSGNSGALQPFLGELGKEIEVRAIGYARNPWSWLPSAYVQWGIRDKTGEGPVPGYEEKARQLVRWYKGLIEWDERISGILEVRNYDQAEDIVQDFAQAAGVDIVIPQKRVLERGEDGEILLRALFNNRFPKHVLPRLFDRAVMGGSQSVPTLDEALSKYFDYGSTTRIVEERQELFDQFRDRFGIDLTAQQAAPPARPDPGQMRDRLFDYMLEITLDQARRLQNLERQVKELREGRGK